MRLKLRCPECQTMMMGTFEAEVVARYDEHLVKGRRQLVAIYERLLRENMQAEAEVFVTALELDLLGPDDFART